MRGMTLALLMSLFQPPGSDELLEPSLTQVVSIAPTLPDDPEFYSMIADEAFAEFLVAAGDDLSFQRFVDVLRLLVYHDGRSELGLLRVAQLAREHPEFGNEGIGALAALANYYRSGGASLVQTDELLRQLGELMEDGGALFHNARECRNAIKASLTPYRTE